jgi:hypothetical protein
MRCVQLIGKRAAYVRNTYKFKTSYRCVLLEPGDIVTLTDPNNAAINLLPVRIQSVTEDEADALSFVAEEFTGIVGSIVAPAVASATPTVNNQLVGPGNVNAPAVFEPNSALTGGVPQVWIAASGGTNWGGAYCYLSLDGGTTYVYAGEITAGATQGVLTANLASHTSPDTVNTLAVDCTQSLGVISPASNADATALRTLSLVVGQPVADVIQTNGELLAFGAVASTGTYSDNLTYLVRGAYGTEPEAHSAGEQFTMIDLTGAQGSTIIYDLPAQYIGETIYLKFISYNIYGQATQELSAVPAYTYNPTGIGFGGGAGGVPNTPTGFAATSSGAQNFLTWNANPASDNVTSYIVYSAVGLSQPFSAATILWQGLATSYVDSSVAIGDERTYFLKAVNAAGESAYA